MHAHLAIERLAQAGHTLARRQSANGPYQGNVPPWPDCDDLDFQGTLGAVWIWARTRVLARTDRFAQQVEAAWSFVRSVWPRFVPKALGSASSDEAPYDCAMVLRAALADFPGEGRQDVRALSETAARLLTAYLTDLDDFSGRDFRDPGFLAWNLAEYARATGDRGMLAAARRFVERAFGMKIPPPFEAEPAASDGLFDFSSTTATRVMAVIAAEGGTPFVGAWLRERVAPAVPDGFVPRPRDENCWNACLAACLGTAFVVATDPVFLRAYQTLFGELHRRVAPATGTLGRQPGFDDETLATFYYGLALDSLNRS
jgi:hypothetical protein